MQNFKCKNKFNPGEISCLEIISLMQLKLEALASKSNKDCFPKHQKLRFEVLDVDIGGTSEFIGYIETSMGQVMGSKH